MSIKNEAPVVQTIAVTNESMPYMIKLIGPTIPTLAQACVHIRQGYHFHPEMIIEILAATGCIVLNLLRGDPDPRHYAAAEAATAEALALEEAERAKEIKAAAKQMIEDEQRAVKQKEINAEIALKKQALKDLEAELSKV
jgi:hypothetical protein